MSLKVLGEDDLQVKLHLLPNNLMVLDYGDNLQPSQQGLEQKPKTFFLPN